MKKIVWLLLLGVISLPSFTQVKYEKGYFTDNDDQTINCFIRNDDWRYNPSSFRYKLSQDGKVAKADINQVKVFEINSIVKYLRSTVEIDRSPSRNLNSVSSNINPVFKIEQLFLRVLVEGDANLYAYKDTNLQRYFYSKEASEIKQLIYKMYKTVDNSVDSNKKRIAYNKKYKQQVRQELNCSPIKSSSIKKLTYQEASLFKYFVAYNECSGAPTKTYGDRQERGQFLLNIRPRINSSSLAVRAVGTNTFNTNFARETGFGLGIEGEFILPFNNQKWSLLIEPTYRKFAQEKIRTSNQVSGGTLQSTVTYNSVELPVGLRRYFFLGKRSTIFANISFYLADSPGTSSVDFRRSDQSIIHSLEVDVRNNLAFGLGYKFDRKFGLEVRFDTDREILMKWQSWRSSYQKVAVILSYTPF